MGRGGRRLLIGQKAMWIGPAHWGAVGRERGVRRAGPQFSVCACVSAVLFMREVKHVSAPARSCSALRICPHVCAFGCKKMYRTKTQAKEVGEYV